MARSDTVTLLPLDRYGALMYIFPPHLNGLWGQQAPLMSGCDSVWDQDARDFLAWTMKQAENLIAIELGFQPAPAFVTDELQMEGLTGVRGDWYRAELKTDYGYVEDFGTEQLTLLQADASVEYLNLDNDPLERHETAEIGNAIYADLPACARPCDVAVFFRVADGAEDAGDPRWEIRPLKVDIDGSTMRIRAEASMFVQPNRWLLTAQNSATDENAWKVDYITPNNFVTQVDVYCRTINTDLPLTLRWDNRCTCTSTPCAHDSQGACAYVTDKRRGFFAPRPATGANTYTPAKWCYPPESVCANYRGGYPLDRNCRMNPDLERAIVKLTNVLLPEPPCNFCDAAQVRWKQDRDPIDPLTPEAASMPWDLYSKGALEAWRIVKKYAMGRGGKLGRQ